MYLTLLAFHSAFRWLVLLSLCVSIYQAFKGVRNNKLFSKNDNALRHWTATIAHIQLIIGILLYTQSPIVKYFYSNWHEAVNNIDMLFFSIIHFLLMICAIVVVTIGSASAKRKETDHEKFKTMLTWFSVALVLIIIAIPWPFSPLANRPYLRPL
ncbi:hypothetical protein [Chryseosolibacter indicus]|uniref:Cytochrome B n=1 Tax=Chryseosolibacter indicus TaxID=2782351 RepID=A0ABS5VPT0_9BACT|nr:hypothetical protein [Chryseosolibacter indicus]MBT1702784.1 hypothetical protein [Chryseosolibacter indicus]